MIAKTILVVRSCYKSFTLLIQSHIIIYGRLLTLNSVIWVNGIGYDINTPKSKYIRNINVFYTLIQSYIPTINSLTFIIITLK